MSARSLSPGYVQIDRWTAGRASWKSFAAAAILSGVLAFASLWVLSLVQLAVTGLDVVTFRAGEFVAGLAIGAVAGLVLHELAHAVAFLAFGARPRFGFKPWTRIGPVFYVSAPGCYLDRKRFAAAGLAPRVLLTALLPPVLALAPEDGLVSTAAYWAYLLGVLGSAGDLLILLSLMSYPGVTRFEDTGDGFSAFGPASGLEQR